MPPCRNLSWSEAQRKKQCRDSNYVFLASAEHLLGFLRVDRLEQYQDPDGSEMQELLAFHEAASPAMQSRLPWEEWQSWEQPLKACVGQTGLLPNPLAFQPRRNTKFLDANLLKEVLAMGFLPQAPVEGWRRQVQNWQILRLPSVPEHILNAMRNGAAMTLPLKPSDVKHCGLDRLMIEVPFDPGFCDWAGLDDGDGDDGDTSSDEGPEREPDSARGLRWPMSQVLNFFKLSTFLRRQASTSDIMQVLELAADILLEGDELDAAKKKLKDGTIRPPGINTQRRTRIKLDSALMLWDQRLFNASAEEVRIVGSLAIDASKQSGFNYLMTRNDMLIIPGSLSCRERLELDLNKCFRRHIWPAATLGYGEADLAHKIRCVLHGLRIQSGTKVGMQTLRWSMRGAIFDQGTERLLDDIPNMEAGSSAESVVQEMRNGNAQASSSDPSSFQWPLLVKVTGPLHQGWNAFEHACTSAPGFTDFIGVVSAILSILGDSDTNSRFITKCGVPHDEVHLFQNWPYSVVDWKWEYMERVFRRLSDTINIFLKRFDSEAFRGTNSNAKSIKIVEKCQSIRTDLVLECEVYKTFGAVVGKNMRWFVGCDCHDWIWTQPVSPIAKLRMLKKHCNLNDCWRQGRRASALARGKAREMIASVRNCNSEQLQIHLTSAPLDLRTRSAHLLHHLTSAWCEEIEVKWAYWEKPPWLLLGIWPVDAESQRICVEAEHYWEEMAKQNRLGEVHRYTFRIMSPTSPTGFRRLVHQGAMAGVIDPLLAIEIQEANFLPTHEQRVEELHARIHALQAKPGKPMKPPTVGSRLRTPQVMELLKCWHFKCFLASIWQRQMCRVVLRSTDLGNEFIRHAKFVHVVDAIYHCLPRQQFCSAEAEIRVVNKWRGQHKIANPVLAIEDKAGLEHVRSRLDGQVFSIPRAMADLAVKPDSVDDAVPGDALAVVDFAPLLKDALELAQKPASVVKLGRDHASHVFFKVVKTNLAMRQVLATDPKRFKSIAAVRLNIAASDGVVGNFSVVSEETTCLNMVSLFSRIGFKKFVEEMVVWEMKPDNVMFVSLPAAGDARSSILAMPHAEMGGNSTCLELQPRRRSNASDVWHAVIKFFIDLPSGSDVWYDVSSETLKSLGSGSLEIAENIVQDMVHVGMLRSRTTELGDASYDLNHQAVSFSASFAFSVGSTDALSHTAQKASNRVCVCNVFTVFCFACSVLLYFP